MKHKSKDYKLSAVVYVKNKTRKRKLKIYKD